MSSDPSRPSQYPLPPWSSAPPPSHEYHAAPVSQYPPPPQSAPPYQYPPPTADMNGVPHPSHPPPPPHMQPPHPSDPYRLPPPPPGPFQRPPVEYYGPPPPPVAPPQVVYQAAAPRQRTAIACRYCRRRKIRCSGFDSSADGRCSNCVRFNQECMFTPVSSQTQAFVPAQAAYPHLRSINGIAQTQNSIPPTGRPAGRPAYAAEGVMLYGAYGQPLNTTLRGAPPAPPAPPPTQVQATLPPQQSAAGAPVPHPVAAAPLPPQSEAPTLQPIYAHPQAVSGPPTTVATVQAPYQPQPPPEQSNRKRPRPEDLHHGSQAASPQPTISGPSPPARTQAAPFAKARASTASTSAPPEHVQERRDGVNGTQSSSPPSQAHTKSPESSSAQGTRSALPASSHPGAPPPLDAHIPPSSQQPPLVQMTTSAPTFAHPPSAYTTALYPPQAAYYPPPPPHQAGQPSPHAPGPDGRPVYMYDQRSAPINGHAVPPHHVAQPSSTSYPPTTALPLHPRPPHAYQQPPPLPPTHQYVSGSQPQPQPQPQLHSQSQSHQHQQAPSPVPTGPQRSPTKPTPQPPYASPPLSKPKETHPMNPQAPQTVPQSTAISPVVGPEQVQSRKQTPKDDKMQPANVATSSGTSHTGTTVTPPQQIQIPATLQPSARATPTSATVTSGGPGSSGGSSGRGLSVLDLCGPDSNAAPAAKARSTTDSDMLNALSRKV